MKPLYEVDTRLHRQNYGMSHRRKVRYAKWLVQIKLKWTKTSFENLDIIEQRTFELKELEKPSIIRKYYYLGY